MPDLDKAKNTADFFAGTTSKPHFVVNNNKDGSTDKFIPVGMDRLTEKKISLDDPRIVYSTKPIGEIKAEQASTAKAKASTAEKAPVVEKAPAASAATVANKPVAEAKAPAATKAPVAKSTVATKVAAVAASIPTPVKSDFTMVSVHNDQYNWFLDHGLSVPQGLLVAQKYHASMEKQAPGKGDEALQKLTAPKVV